MTLRVLHLLFIPHTKPQRSCTPLSWARRGAGGEVVSSSRRCSALTKILLCFFYFTKEPKASGYSCTNERRTKWHERGALVFPGGSFCLSKRTEVQAKPRLIPKCAARGGDKLTPDLNSPHCQIFQPLSSQERGWACPPASGGGKLAPSGHYSFVICHIFTYAPPL